jgi:DNA helicase II / ATP-dependent DNA helicase PcrA
MIERGASTPAEAAESISYVDGFVALASKYDSIERFLEELGPLAGQANAQPPNTDHLAIHTIHASKGLEWGTVILPGWSELSFPRFGDDVEEERRLAYVAVTRAIDRLVLMHPRDPELSRLVRDPTAVPDRGAGRQASPFLYEGHIGVSRRAAAAIRGDAEATIVTRYPAVLRRYLNEAGITHVQVEVPAANPALPPASATASAATHRRRGALLAPPGMIAIEHPLPAGTAVYSDTVGTFVVKARSGDGSYLLADPAKLERDRWWVLDEGDWWAKPAAVASEPLRDW